MTPPYGRRVTAAATLAACALMLWVAGSFARHAPRGAVIAGGKDAAAAAAVDSLLGTFGVASGDVTTWGPKAGGAPTGRIEERIIVPPAFRSLEFNHALSRRLAPLGMSVVATERSRENSVTMHIVRGGYTIRSLAFVAEGR